MSNIETCNVSGNTEAIKAITKPLPEHKGNKRVWIETQKLFNTELSSLTYHYSIDAKKKQLTIETKSELDNRKVTVRKSKNIPIIDICNADITALYKDVDKITIKIYKNKIVITPLNEAVAQKKAKKKLGSKEITFCDIFAGSGTLSEALKGANMKSVGAVELEKKYLDNYELNNPKTFTYETSVAEIEYSLLPNATVMAAGLPCECYTQCGISKRNSLGKNTKEAGDTGSLGYYFLRCVESIRPALILLEEDATNFPTSSMADLIRSVLGFMGYKITEKIVVGTDYGSMTKRKRFALVATMSDKPFVFSNERRMNFRTIEDILEVPIDARVWLDKNNSKTMAYSLKKEQAHIAKGDGFRLARTRLTDSVTATITKGYYKMRLTDPILVHPEDETKFSWFTPKELSRINGLPDSFILPDVKSRAGEIIGQGICYEAFHSVAEDIVKHLKGN